MIGKYYSQYEQDRIIHREFFLDKKEGFFLEAGADDGIDKSNTKFFEDIGWDGICIEPSRDRFKKLVKNRKCICVNKAISTSKGTEEFLDIIGYGKGLSGLTKNYDSRHLVRINSETRNSETVDKKTIQVESLPLSEILKIHNISNIDYLSLDVEGSEKEVLEY